MEESKMGKDVEAAKTEEVVATEPTITPTTNNTASKSNKNTAAIVLSIFALVFGCAGLALGWMGFQKSSTPLTFLSSGTDGNSANFVEGSIAEVADKVSKSVVSIVTSTKTTDFFGQSYDSAAAGTGIIVTEDGYILTNKHVINGANKVTVVLDDGTTYENVKVVATDPLNDVAYLKIDDVSGLTAAKLGDSKTISVGQQVIAIGNALGQYQNTVTSGIISGIGRSVTASDDTGYNTETLTDMIQTDAAINSGNSGGPLVNAAGEVIGINTATSTSAENMGFAIPISSAKGMLSQLIETGSAKRTYLGVYSVEITPEVAKAYNLPVSEGVYLYSPSSYSAIVKNSPAAKAGLKDKDIVTAINGVKVGASGSLANLIGEYKPGDTVQLTVIRDGNETAINVTLEGYSD
ncbi:trypsin-like peptidase domain-containing protein [Candidatus Saccharibacteria bacterium]|nr:trypsin-like peptidase domain-containing protein [Candidatus Saccharibacteria bacterium]